MQKSRAGMPLRDDAAGLRFEVDEPGRIGSAAIKEQRPCCATGTKSVRTRASTC